MKQKNDNNKALRGKDMPLDREDVTCIKQKTIKEIKSLTPYQAMILTHNFNERYARLVVAKGNTAQQQGELLKVLREAFVEQHCWSGNNIQNIPVYFDKWRDEISRDILISVEDEYFLYEETGGCIASISSQMEINIEEGKLHEWLDKSTNGVEAVLQDAKDKVEGMLHYVAAMRDGSIARIQKRLTAAKEENERLRDELEKLRKWHRDWMELRQEMLKNYDSVEIIETGGLDDPTLMAEVIKTFMEGYLNEKKLREENKRLSQNKEMWRESKEFLEEKAKWKKEQYESVRVADIKRNLLSLAKIYGGNWEMLYNFFLNFDQVLRGAPWDIMSGSILSEIKEVYDRSHSKYGDTHINVGRDLVMAKNVEHEVANVERGGIGIKVGKK